MQKTSPGRSRETFAFWGSERAQHGAGLLAGRGVVGAEAAVRHTVDDAGAVQRLHGGQGVGRDAALVRERGCGLLRKRDAVLLRITVEHDGHILPRDRRVRIEGRLARAVDDRVRGRPVDVARIPGVARHVGEWAGRIGGHVRALQQGKHLHKLRARDIAGRLEGRWRHAVDHAGFIHLPDVRIAPAALGHVREREAAAARRGGIGVVDILHDAAVERVRLDKAAVEHTADELDVVK